MNKRGLTLLVVAGILAMCCGLPIQQAADDDRPLDRAKRTEEIVYGNHQNAIRIKKTGPIPARPDDVIADGKSSPDADTMPADASPEGIAESIGHVDEIVTSAEGKSYEEPAITKGNDLPDDDEGSDVAEDEMEGDIAENEVEGDIAENKVEGDISENEVEGDIAEDEVEGDIAEDEVEGDVAEDEVEGDEAEDEMESDVSEDNEESAASESPSVPDTSILQGLKEEDSLQKLHESIDTAADSTFQEAEDEGEAAVASEEGAVMKVPYKPSMSVDDWYEYIYRPYMLTHNDYRQKRSTGQEDAAMLNAEHMTDGFKSDRVKRDLTEEEIQAWLEQEAADPYGYSELYGDSSEDDSLAAPVESSDEYLQRLLESEQSPGEVVDEDYNTDLESPDYPLDEVDEDYIDPEAVTRAKLAILRYLYGDEDDGSDVVEESYRDLEDDEPVEEVQYQPLVYEGVPGIFIPVKRQFLSLDPGIRKRGSDFYPYNYEPAGRWNAFVPDMMEEKRTADAYERLYRMAQALGQ